MVVVKRSPQMPMVGQNGKKRQEPTPPRYTKISAKTAIEQPKRPRTTSTSKKDNDFEDNNMDTADGNYEEFSSDEDMKKVRKFVRETQPPKPVAIHTCIDRGDTGGDSPSACISTQYTDAS